MKRLFRHFATVTTVALLAACAMGPDYERPEVPVPEGYQVSAIPGESFANMAWWEIFDDQELIDLIETALVNNKQLAIAMARIEEARATLGFTRAEQFPLLDGQAGASRGNTIPGQNVPGSINEQFILAANLSYEVDLWGKLRRSTEAARAELMATVQARNVVTITLISDVASLYLLLLDLDARIEISRRTEATREDSLGIIQARFDKGIVPLIDVNQAEIELGDARAESAQLVRQRGLAENSLRVLLGRNPGPITRTSEGVESTLDLPEIPAGLPSELLERRPDIRQASQELAAQTARIGVAEALRFPSLSLTGSLGLASDDLSGFLSSDNKVWGISANLFGPILDAGRNKARVEAEIARTEQLISNYQLTVLTAFQEVEDALIEIQTFRDEAEAREAQVTSAQSAAMLSRARYDGGVTSYLEVLESERSLFRTELQASQARREQIVAIVSLYKALGGGWATAEEIDEAGGFIEASMPPQQSASNP
ncbi:MAG: efflux transporter outer membrane subunit [Xanthomonadales bacterium]|jgi:multidrug efflux system outer membrane protein|nr:efflux transporter outer membrane subunit [Xanthomonadales bacterium]MDH3942377.1 efflux transporter outer membrane subunit [Xanthomonadales bacterium]MDH4001614.1 efflux transporter outer membrane subunit [Xanthomonadales bacterium]